MLGCVWIVDVHLREQLSNRNTFEGLVGFCQWTRNLDLAPEESEANHVREVVRHASVRVRVEELLHGVDAVQLHRRFGQHHQVDSSHWQSLPDIQFACADAFVRNTAHDAVQLGYGLQNTP